MQACFAAGTPLRTPDGSKPIEQFRLGDLVLSRSEVDPQGAIEAKRVEEVFVRTGRIFNLHVGGQVIRTTAEHPFFVEGRGWVPAGELALGVRVLTEACGWVPVEDLLDTGEHERVYNLRVADFHTYFVGDRGSSVWSHNVYFNSSDLGPGGSLTAAQAAPVFNLVANRLDIAFRFPPDGCYARAHIMGTQMQELGLNPGKVWAFRIIEPLRPDFPGLVDNPNFTGWRYHVAPTLPVIDEYGEVQHQVFDPSMFDGPVPISEWVDEMNAPSRVKRTIWGEPPIPERGGTGYWPAPDPAGGLDAHARAKMQEYLPRQWPLIDPNPAPPQGGSNG